MLETFTLIIWLYAGLRFAEVRVEGLGRDECVKLLYAAQGSRYLAFRQTETGRSPAKGKCVGANGTIAPRAISPEPVCAHTSGSCSWPLLPGRGACDGGDLEMVLDARRAGPLAAQPRRLR